MPKVSPIQSSFSAGEVSPLVKGRVDMERYKEGMETCLNYVPVIQGPVTRRPGTRFITECKAGAARLIPFKFSQTDSYMLEFGDQYIRFYKDYAQIQVSAAAYEIATPYSLAHVHELKYEQSADTIYLTHKAYAPRKLIRRSDSDWSLVTQVFTDGPYLPLNVPPTILFPVTSTTLTPSAATGSGVTLTAGSSRTITGAASNGSGLIRITSAAHGFVTGEKVLIASVGGTTEANGTWFITVISTSTFDLIGSTFTNAYTAGGTAAPSIFTSTDVGRLIRIKEGSTWGWVRVTGYTSGAVVTVTVLSTLTDTTSKDVWRFGAFSDRTASSIYGYPSCVAFHEDRLVFSGVPESPLAVYASESGDYEDFTPSSTDGTVVASNALTFVLNADDVNAVRWMVSDEKGLLLGTMGGEWVLKGASSSAALSATNVDAKKSSRAGSADIAPVKTESATLYVQNSGRKLREFTYFYDVDRFRSIDLSLLSEHMTISGIRQIAYQREPHSVVWGIRTDGTLVGCTYQRESDSLRAGWHKHAIGGTAAAGYSPTLSGAAVASIACIPAGDDGDIIETEGTRDDLWLVVTRKIDGSSVSYIEVLERFFEETENIEDSFFVDSGLSHDSPYLITAMTNASPIAVTTSIVSGGPLSNGEQVRITGVSGMTEVNDQIFTVGNVTGGGATFTLTGVDGTAYGTFISTLGAEFREVVSSVSGLDHLEGEEVRVLADGAEQANKTVSSGAITLDEAASIVHVGLPMKARGQLLRLNSGAADGTAMGKTRRTHKVGFLFHRTLGVSIGTDFENLTPIEFRTSGEDMDSPAELYSGIKVEEFDADYDFENKIAWEQDNALPGTILAVFPQMVTQDR